MKNVIIWIIVFAIGYLVCSFTAASFDPFEWQSIGRFLYVGLSVCIAEAVCSHYRKY